MAKTVVVGMSGGVDSAVAAALLKEQGYKVIGLFMHNWEEQDESGACTSVDDWNDALSVSGTLGIPCYSVNFSKEYMEQVFSYFLDEYKKGRTPNPDVLCNREIKFGPFKQFAKELGADYIATGHYCKIAKKDGQSILLKPADKNKDQTYFLNQVSSKQLDDVIFPLSDIQKPEVREIATKYGFINAKKKDSTGICFIGERKFKEFLAKFLPAQSGKIIDINGNYIGTHQGLMYYTIGQRRGLGIGGRQGTDNDRWYVVDKDLQNNTLIVSCGEGEELFSSGLKTEKFNWIGIDPSSSFECTAKFRYRQNEQKVRVVRESDFVYIEFFEKQRAITPGQYAVLYLGEQCLGGGVIEKVYK